ncbi:MAG: DUF2071 domain-containing protein [Chitinophagaceae bacterium]
MDAIKKIFLTASWENLIMANYEIEPAILVPYLPAFTELDFLSGKCYVSLVGFMFEKVKIKGISIPFHTSFPEINLRFYVKHTAKNGTVNRGVVFISEIVPKTAIAWVANNLYKEKYIATAMKHSVLVTEKDLSLEYSWHWKGKDNLIAANVINQLWPIEPGTAEAFIFEHYNGYAKVNESITNQYTVEHPTWNTYPVNTYHIDCIFENFYGSDFAFLDNAKPASVFVAEGSPVVIREKIVLKNL